MAPMTSSSAYGLPRADPYSSVLITNTDGHQQRPCLPSRWISVRTPVRDRWMSQPCAPMAWPVSARFAPPAYHPEPTPSPRQCEWGGQRQLITPAASSIPHFPPNVACAAAGTHLRKSDRHQRSVGIGISPSRGCWMCSAVDQAFFRASNPAASSPLTGYPASSGMSLLGNLSGRHQLAAITASIGAGVHRRPFNSTDGNLLSLGVNRSSNRQLFIADSSSSRSTPSIHDPNCSPNRGS